MEKNQLRHRVVADRVSKLTRTTSTSPSLSWFVALIYDPDCSQAGRRWRESEETDCASIFQ